MLNSPIIIFFQSFSLSLLVNILTRTIFNGRPFIIDTNNKCRHVYLIRFIILTVSPSPLDASKWITKITLTSVAFFDRRAGAYTRTFNYALLSRFHPDSITFSICVLLLSFLLFSMFNTYIGN